MSEAVEAVKELQRRGTRNIDVGCMQINLLYHSDAFDSIESAFEPSINVAYGAKYLSALHNETGSWFTAVRRYHSPIQNITYCIVAAFSEFGEHKKNAIRQRGTLAR